MPFGYILWKAFFRYALMFLEKDIDQFPSRFCFEKMCGLNVYLFWKYRYLYRNQK